MGHWPRRQLEDLEDSLYPLALDTVIKISGLERVAIYTFKLSYYMLLLEIHTCDLSECNKGEPNIKIANIKSFENLSNLKVRLQESSI